MTWAKIWVLVGAVVGGIASVMWVLVSFVYGGLKDEIKETNNVILASLRPASSLNQIRGRSGIPKPDSPKPDHALAQTRRGDPMPVASGRR